ncbi:MAG: Ada metal-binding domain-containing protein [Bryobacteraceae bacterium]
MYTTMEPVAGNEGTVLAEQWRAAVRARDRSTDGKFYQGVITTGVFCRPSCPARLPLRKNVRFYETPAEAAHDGLRPCLRCRPTGADPDAARMSAICRYIQAHATEPLTLAALSRGRRLRKE